jgi:hypothetical protein
LSRLLSGDFKRRRKRLWIVRLPTITETRADNGIKIDKTAASIKCQQ